MKKALEYIINSIVESPKNVAITENEDSGIINYTVKVAASDMGRIIGKNGKVIRGIRNVIKIPAIKHNKKINITLSENTSQ